MLKIIMAILISFLSINTSFSADYTNLNIGQSLSLHPFAQGTAKEFSNKVTSNGMIVRNYPTITLSNMSVKQGEYTKWSFIYSRDCVNSPVYAVIYSYGTYRSKYLYTGFAFGGYFMSDKEWNKREIAKSWISLHNKYTGPHTAVVPVIGGEINVKVLKLGPLEINWSSYLNPFLINTTLNAGFSF